VDVQHQIKRTLNQPAAIARIDGLLAQGDLPHRTALARQVCEQFGFYDGRGRAQLSGCLRALRELESAGHFALPEACTRPGTGGVKRLPEPVPPACDVPGRAGDVRGLQLVLVASDEQMRTWNELMLREHPQGAGPLVGAQLRYLIGSAHGWLGGFGFSSAALQLRDRDTWLGWDVPTRREQLHRVVNMSRFLLRDRGCHNLASRVMGEVLGRVADDFSSKYGYRPWLVESFVDTEVFEGTCYRASNWIEVGQTRGRGRQDRARRSDKHVKAIYLYPLVQDWRSRLGLAPAPAPLGIDEGLDGANWVELEFGGAPLGDRRLSRRLVDSARRQAEHPGRAFTGIARGDWPATKGYYRLIDQPAGSAVTMAAILQPHQSRTLRRMQAEERVLCIQDGTTLNYTGLEQCVGLGVTGRNQTGAQSRGLLLHSTLAISGKGIPLGIVEARCRAPDPEAEKSKPGTPIEQKKTYDWVKSTRTCMALAAQMPQTRITCVMDREADFFELFDELRNNPCVDVLMRAKHNRRLGEESKLFDHLRSSEARGELRLTVKRRSARGKRSKQQARTGRVQREAMLTLHYESVEFPPPSDHRDKAPVRLWVVHGVEHEPPEGVEPLEWFLLTTRAIGCVADAQQCLQDYALRWRIEDWHRVLKSGCEIEKLAHQRVERLERALAINLVIAWHIMVMTLLGRDVPELPAEVLFSDLEIEVLQAYAEANGLKAPKNLGESVLLVARLGGYLGRKHDPPPGHQLIWHGYRTLTSMCMGYALRPP
jgi:hypothetical protein